MYREVLKRQKQNNYLVPLTHGVGQNKKTTKSCQGFTSCLDTRWSLALRQETKVGGESARNTH